MSFIKSLFSRKKEPQFQDVGNLESICPHCSNVLLKRPGRKAKCPHCGNYIFVRTRPSDERKVLVTESQAQEIDEQWMRKHETYDAYLERQEEFRSVKAELTKKFGQEASDHDVQWFIFNKRSMDHAVAMNWGLYRNTRLEMGQLLQKEKRHQQALDFYIEVSYIDSNGPENNGAVSDPEKYPAFNLRSASQAPAVVLGIHELAEQLTMDEKVLKKRYLLIAEQIRSRLKLSVSPEQAWQDYKQELFDTI